jgi:hypothetical protein
MMERVLNSSPRFNREAESGFRRQIDGMRRHETECHQKKGGEGDKVRMVINNIKVGTGEAKSTKA